MAAGKKSPSQRKAPKEEKVPERAAQGKEPAEGEEFHSPEEKYYRLKTRAVEDLVSANEQNSPPVSAAELKKYRSGPHFNLADWAKALLIKIWFAGVICYFFIWGLSTFTLNPWDHIVIIAAALGTVTNLITNNVLRFIAPKKKSYDRWMMVPSRKIRFLPLDLLYALVLMVCVLATYNLVNSLAASAFHTEGAVLGVEPVLFGVFTTAWDLVFLGVKHLFARIVTDAREKVESH